jgi:23S rRNA U2552 (ribose-2'-O)-methylase RlmE/FtsJ
MNIQEEITRFTDLEANDSLSAFRGHTAQQNHGAFKVFYDFIKDVKPKRILEIGTSLGGFTTFLKIVCDDLNLDTNIRSYDINRHSWYDDIIKLGIDIRVENIFTEGFKDFSEEVKEYIRQDGATIVLCDGGWKIGEFNVISKYIKNNDFILAHDYAENKEVFETKILNKIWNWHEIQKSDIQNSIDSNNLIEFLPEIFSNVAWGCFIKQDT